MLLVVTASVAYLALPSGRLCPHCGGATSPVVLRRLLKLLSPWLQWRWCSRCGWEGPGRRSPDLEQLDPEAGQAAGFRGANPDIEKIPTFYWRSDDPGEGDEARPKPLSEFIVPADGEPIEPEPPGFHFRPPGKRRQPQFQWAPKDRRRPPPRPKLRGQTPRPWYLSWLVSKDPPGFQWREPED